MTIPDSYTFHVREGARRNGKTTGAGARDWYDRNRATGPRYDHRTDWIDAGLIADPIVFTEADILALNPTELAELEASVFVPGCTVWTTDGPMSRRVTIEWDRPCVTTLPPRDR